MKYLKFRIIEFEDLTEIAASSWQQAQCVGDLMYVLWKKLTLPKHVLQSMSRRTSNIADKLN